MTTLTAYMGASAQFRKALTNFCVKRYEAQQTRNTLAMLDAADNEAESNEEFRNEFYKWLTDVPGYMTIKLREFAKQVGYDYWNSLEESNIIDCFDSVSAILSHPKTRVELI